MRCREYSVCCLLIFLHACVTPVLSQDYDKQPETYGKTDSPSSTTTATQLQEYGIWFGYSFHSPTSIGAVEGRQFVIAALRFGNIFAYNHSLALQYTLDIIPVAVVTDNPIVAQQFEGQIVPVRDVYGIGLAPLGLQFYWATSPALQWFVGGSLGFIQFMEDVPVIHSSRFNFTFDLGLGVQIPIHSQHTMRLGYRYHHLSNANTSRLNPGLDASIFYLSYALQGFELF